MTELKHTVIPIADTVPTRALMHPLVDKMIATNPTPEALEKLLAMQREWEANEAKKAYTVALTELKRELPTFLPHDKSVDYQGAKGAVHYTHTSLAAAMATVTPLLSNYGFSMTWKPGNDGKGGVTVTATLTHRQGHSEQATLTAPPDASGNKSAPQAIASTVTLLQRYTALALLGLATADMIEPSHEAEAPNPEKIDTARNMRAMADLVKTGKKKKEIEEYIGKSCATWTEKDLDKLRTWKLSPKATGSAPVASEHLPAVDEAPSASEFDTTTEPEGGQGAFVTKDQWIAAKGFMKDFKLSPEQLQTIIENTFSVRLEGLHKLRKPQYAQLALRFGRLKQGEITLGADLKWQEPPEAE